MESCGISGQPGGWTVWRRVVLLRLSEAARARRQFADQFDGDAGLRVGLLRDNGPVFFVERRFTQREPRGVQLPSERHWGVWHRTNRPALPLNPCWEENQSCYIFLIVVLTPHFK